MRDQPNQLPVLIVGGGIGGLGAALALAQKGHTVRLFEQAADFKEVGAGIQLGPNVFRMFGILGLTEAVSRLAVFPESLIMLDADYFKRFNDIYGHPVGDSCLRSIALALQQGLNRPAEFVARYGGEEFLIIIPSCNPPDLRVGAERLRCSIADQPIESPAGPITSTISIGVASAPMAEEGTSELEALLKVSDEALYRAKNGGRNRVEIALAIRAAVAGV